MKTKLFSAALLVLATLLFNPVWAQESPTVDRTATGGAQTLEDIMRRQQQLEMDDSFRSENLGNPENAAPTTAPLGTNGGRSDADVWRSIRYNEIDPRIQSPGPANEVMIQDAGMPWYQLREGPIITYGGGAILGALFLEDVLFDGRPAGAAEFHRPAIGEPALFVQDRVPALHVFLGQITALAHLGGQLGRELFGQKRAHLVAKGDFLGRIIQVHQLSPLLWHRRLGQPALFRSSKVLPSATSFSSSGAGCQKYGSVSA